MVAALLLAAGPASAQPEPPPATDAQPAAEVGPIEVEVVGRRDAPTTERADPTPAAYVLRGEALRSSGLTAAELLGRVPGVQTTRSGGPADLATASVRGATSAQTPVYLGGVRLNDDLTGTADLSTLPLWMLDRIEVYRGHAPLDADRMGIGGAVRFEPRFPSGGPELGAGMGVGSFGTREARGSFAMGGRDAAALIALRHSGSDGDYDFLDDGGTRFDPSDDRERARANADHRGLDFWAIGRLRGKPAQLTMLLHGFSREAGAPGLQRVPARAARAHLKRSLAGIDARVPCAADGEGGPECSLELASSALVTRYRLNDPARELGGARRSVNAGERLTQRLRLRVGRSDGLQLALGSELEQQKLRLDLDQRAAQRAARQLFRGDLSASLRPLDELALVAVGAFECHSTASREQRDTCGVLEPVARIGARWRPLEPLAFHLNLGRYVRVPTLGELFGISAALRGNPLLRAENGIGIDAGVALESRGGWLAGYTQLFGFARFASDLIAFRRSSVGSLTPFNAASARVLGSELAAGAWLGGVVRAGAAVTLLDPRDTSDDRLVANDLLPLQSRLVLVPELELATPQRWQLLTLDRASLTARYLYRSARVTDPAGLLLLEAQGSLDLDAALWFLHRRLVFRGRLANLADQRTFDLVGYPLPGRAAHLLVEARW
jgi:iron complex outermembrane receptor protein